MGRRYVRWFVPETLAHPKLFRWQAVMPHRVMSILVSTPAIRNVAIVFWSVNMCFGPYQLGALYSEMRFGWDALDIGLFLGCVTRRQQLARTAARFTRSPLRCGVVARCLRYAGFTAMITQGVLTPLLLPRLGYLDSMCVGVAFGIFHFGLLGLSSSEWMCVDGASAAAAAGGRQGPRALWCAVVVQPWVLSVAHDAIWRRRWYVIVPVTSFLFLAFPATRGYMAKQVPRHMQGRLQGGCCAVRSLAWQCEYVGGAVADPRAPTTGAIGSLNTISTAISPLWAAGVYSLSEHVADAWPPTQGEFHLASSAMWLTSSLILVPVLGWTLYLRYVGP